MDDGGDDHDMDTLTTLDKDDGMVAHDDGAGVGYDEMKKAERRVAAAISIAAASSRKNLRNLDIDGPTKELCERVLTTQGLPEFEACPVRDILPAVDINSINKCMNNVHIKYMCVYIYQ